MKIKLTREEVMQLVAENLIRRGFEPIGDPKEDYDHQQHFDGYSTTIDNTKALEFRRKTSGKIPTCPEDLE